MKLSKQGLIALIIHEGIVPAPYKDSVGVWTYGIGHTAAAGWPDPAKMAKGMPADLDAALRDVFAVFAKDIAKYEADVLRAVKVPLKQHQFDALVSFHYNTGAIGRATLTKHINAGNMAAAAKAFMSWVKPKEITERRRDEQRLFADGVYPDGKATVWQANAAGKVIWKPARTLTRDQVMALAYPLPDPIRTAETLDPVAPAEKPAGGVAAGGMMVAIGVAVYTFWADFADGARAFWDNLGQWIDGLW